MTDPDRHRPPGGGPPTRSPAPPTPAHRALPAGVLPLPGAHADDGTDVVECWAERLAATAGFADIEHTLELSGVCDRCLPGRE
ncbi:hypothetical protein [Streptomyces synnematoformans]|uniref:Uncharacterized protein n=1 Tax=Streptomyces synnematoformans TaxID=415721 RepID=A0ABN2XBZ9_9ACTN